jgi:hypothetical protein
MHRRSDRESEPRYTPAADRVAGIMNDQVIIPARFRGPPDSANGGYTCGLVANLLDGPAEVTLRRPPPLDTAMAVVRPADGQLEIHDDHGLVAEGQTTSEQFDVPPPIGLEKAKRAAADYRGFQPGATFASCFVCSPEREDGLRIVPGPLEDVLAAPWTPDSSLGNRRGIVGTEIIWAALDCPTFFASTEPGQLALLGRMAAEVSTGVRAGRPHVVVAQKLSSNGRKRFGSAAIYTAEGELCAVARTTWITIDY